MTSEQALQENLPVAQSILKGHGILPGTYSVSTYLKPDGNYGCRVSPLPNGKTLFTVQVQQELEAAGFLVQIT